MRALPLPYEESGARRSCAARCGPPRSPPPAGSSPGPRPSPRCGRSAPSARSRARRAASPPPPRPPQRRRQPLLPRGRAPARQVTALELEVRPPRPTGCRAAATTARCGSRGGVATRLLHVERQPGAGAGLAAGARPGRRCGPRRSTRRAVAAADRRADASRRRPARSELELAIERMRFVLGVDDDLGEFHRRFRRDPLVGPLIRRLPSFRPRRRRLALGGAGGGGRRAADRGRSGRSRSSAASSAAGAPRLGRGARGPARRPRRGDDRRPRPGRTGGDGPRPEPGGGAAAGRRGGRRAGAADSSSPAADRRLLAMPQIGPWTVQCLAPVRPRRDGLAAGRRPRLHQAGRPPRRPRPPRHGRRGRGVLRAV